MRPIEFDWNFRKDKTYGSQVLSLFHKFTFLCRLQFIGVCNIVGMICVLKWSIRDRLRNERVVKSISDIASRIEKED
jgi:hypothetical protein